MSKRRQRRVSSSEDESREEPQKKSRRNNEDKENEDSNVDQNQSMALVQEPSSSFSHSYPNVQEAILKNLKSGKIKKISLQNFMCHRNFAVELNENVNVFVGDNGSGKSAILAALAIGLGSKASSTARSTSLKELVRRGENSATIEIVLANDGIDAYESEVYGKEITVVRHITASGASTYKLKDESGKTITSSRGDLVKLTLCLNIQVENPVLILNQDAARSFLKECEPKKLYQFFLKATQIETIIDKLNACFQIAIQTKQQLDNVTKTVTFLSKEVTEIDEKYKRLKSVESIQEEIEQFKNELNWLRVSEVEVELAKCQKQVQKKQKELLDLEDFVKNRKSYEDDLKKKISETHENFLVKQSAVSEKSLQYETMKREALTIQDQVSEFARKLKKALEKKSRIAKDIEQVEGAIKEHEDNPLNVDNQKRQNEMKLVDLRGKLDELKGMLDSAKRDIQMLSDTIEQNREKHQQHQQRQRQVQNNVLKITEQIKQIDLSAKDSLSVYGRSMPNLVNRIKQLFQKKKFAQMPRGPLGQYIEVPNKKYKNAVENLLGPMVHSFYVSCDKDRIVMGDLLKNEFSDLAQKTTIITGQFQDHVYDISRGMCRPPNGAQLLMNSIKVSDPVVMNCLIDNRAIETILLVDDTDLGIQLTSEEQNVPRNLSKVILTKPFSEYYPAPNYRSYTLSDKPARYLQGSTREIKQQLENEKLQEEQKLVEANNYLSNFQEQIRSANQILNEKQGSKQKIQQKFDSINRQIEEIQNIEYPPENETQYLKEELERLKLQIEKIDKEISEEKSKKDAIDTQLKEKESALKDYKKEMKNIENELQLIQAEIDSSNAKMSEMNTDIRFKKNQINNHKGDLSELEKNEKEYQERVDELVGHTQRERVRSNLSEEKLNSLIKKKQRIITQIQSTHENIDEIKLLLDNKTDHLKKMDMIKGTFEIANKKLQKIRETRYENVQKLKSHMSLKVKHKFNALMGLRNYKAEANINHNQKTLELKVVPRDAGIKGAVSNTKSLSGGERSYSTVAFLISLWSVVDHPFYFLDEYDVFSDDYNRHIMTMLLFSEAQKNADRQYGFLTPQDLTNIEANDHLVIHKLQDPKRC